ncbi:hypothetical protein RJ639_024153 [Escallonia herrerae]|uniref:ABC1 atypical kinase-like domain-containing protein n=1 Tax=Escallonia herrerae TaxID=1293975 RepID=A0AA88V024_9ASTE|nr:hypothetical protein RJ639_024153 [Escallonia herrerae]
MRTRIFKLPAKAAKASLYLITATIGVTAASAAALTSSSPNPKSLTDSPLIFTDNIRAAFHGVIRSSRALFTITANVVDYKFSLRGLTEESDEYRLIPPADPFDSLQLHMGRTLGLAREVFRYFGQPAIYTVVHLRSAHRILRLCEANRGFYVKAGQFVAALRQVPSEYSSALKPLQDQAVPCHFRAIRKVLIRNLGPDLSEIFLSLDERPIAAASIAQVHRALLKDHQEVAVKVQYPGLEQQMKLDLATMSFLSKSVAWLRPKDICQMFWAILVLLELRLGRTAYVFTLVISISDTPSFSPSSFLQFFPEYRFQWMVSEFAVVIALELDFVQEARNSERTANNFKNNTKVRVPYVFQEFTTSQVLTMQFCRGNKVDDLEFMKEMRISPMKVAKALVEVFAEMIFVHGFLHGDPHPGNILVSPEGPNGFSLVLLDHGIYKQLDEDFRRNYCELWKALILLDSEKIQQIGECFGVGKYSRYFPLIFTGRTIDSKSTLGKGMSVEEKKHLKQELKSLKMDDISSFMESLPPDFLTILRTDGVLRSLISKLGASQRVRLLAYAKYALHGLSPKLNPESGFVAKVVFSRFRSSTSYLLLRLHLGVLELLSWLEDLRWSSIKRFRQMLISASRQLGNLFAFFTTTS